MFAFSLCLIKNFILYLIDIFIFIAFIIGIFYHCFIIIGIYDVILLNCKFQIWCNTLQGLIINSFLSNGQLWSKHNIFDVNSNECNFKTNIRQNSSLFSVRLIDIKIMMSYLIWFWYYYCDLILIMIFILGSGVYY